MPRTIATTLTQEQLKRELHYNPDTGLFSRLSQRTNSTPPGEALRPMSKGYVRIFVAGRKYGAHQLAWLYMTGAWPKNEIDHIDRCRDNNRWGNLREVNAKQNSENSGLQKNSKSGCLGVHKRTWRGQKPTWVARIGHNYRRIHLGSFDTKEEAIEVRELAQAMLYTHATKGPACR